jgi:hypothetical protein
MAARNKIMYSGSSMPTGTRTLDIYRPVDPTLVATAVVNSTKILTAVVFEDLDITEDANTIMRRGTKGEPTDKKLIAGDKNMTGTAQMATNTSTNIQPGDFVVDSFEVDAAGAATATEQYFVTRAGSPEKAEDARKQALTLTIDFTNSVRWQ